jgi:hypothetical protein
LKTIKYAPNGAQLWVATFAEPAGEGAAGNGIVVADDGSVYVSGYSYSSSNFDYSDFVTIKYDEDGNEIWSRVYDGPVSGSDSAVGLGLDQDGNVYVAGTITYQLGDRVVAVVKYDQGGNELWVATHQGVDESAIAMTVDENGNTYVAARRFNSETGPGDYSTIKFNSDGQVAWAHPYDGPAGMDDAPYDIVADDQGNVFVTGGSFGIGTMRDFTTISYAPDGQVRWLSRVDGAGGDDNAYGIALDRTGSVYITGPSPAIPSSSGFDDDFLTLRLLASTGDEMWRARYDGPGGSWDDPSIGAIDVAGGSVYVTGRSSASVGEPVDFGFATIAYSLANGTQRWVARYDTDHSEPAALAANAGAIYVTGLTGTTGMYGDMLTIKYADSAVGGTSELAFVDPPGAAHMRSFVTAAALVAALVLGGVLAVAWRLRWLG